MLIHTVSQYLQSHKRLVVPQLGTFIVKEPSRSVLFSELLKRDDGVLRGLLAEAGVGELEAAGEIDRFVFEVRHAVQHGREYPLPGFGVMKPGPNGTIAFAYMPPAEAEQPAASEPAVSEPAVSPSAPRPAAKQAYVEPRISPSVKMNPERYVKGLRYGKPPKTTDAYTFVGPAPRRRTDRFVIVAIVAALVAVAAIAFGYYREARERRAEAEFIEQLQTPAAQPAEVQPQPTE